MARRHCMMRIAGIVRAAKTVRRELGKEAFDKMIREADALASQACLAFVFDGKTYGDPEPIERYESGSWDPSDCYDGEGFIHEDLNDDSDLKGYDDAP